MVYNIDEYRNLIRSRLSDYRYYHSLCVAECAVKLAKRFGADENKALAAGLLHDVCKETEPLKQLEIIRQAGMSITPLEKKSIKFYHQISGAAFAKTQLGITDCEILDAIRCHTTGKGNMSLLDEVIYLADFISADRDYDDVEVMRQQTEKGREYGLLYAARYTIMSVAKNDKILHPDTVELYNNILIKYFSTKQKDSD